MSLLDSFSPISARTLPVILLLDTSGSMHGDKIGVLNDSVTEMIEELTEADAGHGFITLSIITFGGTSANVLFAHKPIEDVEFTSLCASGPTPLGEALKLARELIEDRDALPSRAYRPTIALVSDGIPKESSETPWDQELDALLDSERGAKATRFALAIGAEANRELLAKFSGDKPHEASEASEIRNFLQFVTTTISQVTLSEFEPDVAPTRDRDESIIRLQNDDAY
ncbi:VWA domain-containing protein [Saccharopolyspora sp. NPDC050642]|uniref:vWA domain-containing protein n=1 Tax=Saccharopolyspora sp. NPDC050642 TaxID=3157099 RepID=UPI0033CA31A6